MSRIAFCECGFILDGSTPSISPLNGWFWPQAPSLVPGFAGDAGYPTAFTPTQYLQRYWNIRTIKVTYNVICTPDPVVAPGPPITISGSFTSMNDSSNEQGLITTGRIGGSDGFASFDSQTGAGGSTKYDALGDLLWPSWGYSNTGATSILTTTSSGTAVPQSVTFTSTTIPGFAGATLYMEPGTGSDSFTGNVDVEVDSYWAYDNGLSPPPPTNGPVFDSTTGTQLIVPAPQGL